MCVCVMCNVCVYVGACVMCVCVWRGGISRGKSSEGGSGTERGKGKVEIGGRGHTCAAAVSLCVKLCSQVKQTGKLHTYRVCLATARILPRHAT